MITYWINCVAEKLTTYKNRKIGVLRINLGKPGLITAKKLTLANAKKMICY